MATNLPALHMCLRDSHEEQTFLYHSFHKLRVQCRHTCSHNVYSKLESWRHVVLRVSLADPKKFKTVK
jgi:hypothetical protein